MPDDMVILSHYELILKLMAFVIPLDSESAQQLHITQRIIAFISRQVSDSILYWSLMDKKIDSQSIRWNCKSEELKTKRY